jgi:hypothetical protein
MVEMNHHHHGETPFSTPHTPLVALSLHRWGDASVSPTLSRALHGVDPSQADQPPKI